jgi:hypothetical protein
MAHNSLNDMAATLVFGERSQIALDHLKYGFAPGFVANLKNSLQYGRAHLVGSHEGNVTQQLFDDSLVKLAAPTETNRPTEHPAAKLVQGQINGRTFNLTKEQLCQGLRGQMLRNNLSYAVRCNVFHEFHTMTCKLLQQSGFNGLVSPEQPLLNQAGAIAVKRLLQNRQAAQVSGLIVIPGTRLAHVKDLIEGDLENAHIMVETASHLLGSPSQQVRNWPWHACLQSKER